MDFLPLICGAKFKSFKLRTTNSQIKGKKLHVVFDVVGVIRDANNIEYNYEVQMAFAHDGTKVFYSPRLEFVENLRASIDEAEKTNSAI